jgi:hypothetical protein
MWPALLAGRLIRLPRGRRRVVASWACDTLGRLFSLIKSLVSCYLPIVRCRRCILALAVRLDGVFMFIYILNIQSCRSHQHTLNRLNHNSSSSIPVVCNSEALVYAHLICTPICAKIPNYSSTPVVIIFYGTCHLSENSGGLYSIFQYAIIIPIAKQITFFFLLHTRPGRLFSEYKQSSRPHQCHAVRSSVVLLLRT